MTVLRKTAVKKGVKAGGGARMPEGSLREGFMREERSAEGFREALENDEREKSLVRVQ